MRTSPAPACGSGSSRCARPLARQMLSCQSLFSSLFPHFLLLSRERKSCAGKMECLEKGVYGLGGSVIQRLGSLALCNSGDNRAQWPLSRWLGDDVCDGVGYLLGIGRCRGSVLCVKRHCERIHSGLIEGQTFGVCRDLAVGRNGGRKGPGLKNGGVDAKGRKFIAIRLGESLQGTTVGHPGVVDHHIKTTSRLDNRCDGPLHGRVIRDIDLDNMQCKLFSLRERAECFCRRGILA